MKPFSKEQRDIHLRGAIRVLLSATFLAFIFFQAWSPQTARAAGLDAWQSGFVWNTDYTAATDGFVVVRVGGGGDVNCDTNLQTEGVSRQYATANNDGSQQSMMMPVRRGASWRVGSWWPNADNTGYDYYSGGNCPRNIYWIPVSTGLFGAWQGSGGNTTNTATTDGFAVARIDGRDINSQCTTDLQTEGVSRQWAHANHDGIQSSMMMPVRKGAPWSVSDSDPGGCPPDIYWLPALTNFLDAWQGGFGVNTVYTAATDGFVVARVGGGGDVNCTTDLQTGGVSRQWGNANHDGSQQSMMMPVRKGDPWTVGSVGGCPTDVYWIPFSAPAPTTGTIIGNATLDGSPWSGPITIDATNNGTLYPNVAITTPSVSAGVPTGSYILAYKSGGPAGATLSSITPSATQTLTAGGTITFTFNFVTTPPSTGTVKVLATKDGVAWDSPAFTANVSQPGATGDVSVDPPQDLTGASTGAYTVNRVTPPAGVTFQNVNGSSLPYGQTLTAGGTITFTVNFITVVTPPPPAVSTLVVSPTSASVMVGGTQQFTAVYDPDGTGPLSSSDVTATAVWSPTEATKVTITPNGGLATRVGHGMTSISASYSGLLAYAYVLDPARIRIITTPPTTPPTASLKFGESTQLQACLSPNGTPTADCSGASETLVTASSNWSPTSNSIASVNNTASKGLVTAGSTRTGSVTVSATYSGVPSATARITVTAPALVVSCSAAPSSATTIDQVVWKATATGGTGSYSYRWSGTDTLNGKTGNPVTVTYPTPGKKTGNVVVTSGSQTSKSTTCDNSVTISNPLPLSVATLTATPSSINKGDSSTLTWTSTNNATRCDSDFSTDHSPINTSPGVPVNPIVDTTYSIYCTNANGVVGPTASATVTVVPVTVSIKASPTCINGGGNSKISWSATPANLHCDVLGPGLSRTGLTGAQLISSQIVPITAKSTYTIACTTNAGSTVPSKSVIVDVSGCWSEF